MTIDWSVGSVVIGQVARKHTLFQQTDIVRHNLSSRYCARKT
jgi:hypothetical protein